MDLINRQYAIERYGHWYVEQEKANGFIGNMRQFLKMLPSAQPDHIADAGKMVKWIPCSERLPEYGIEVLTYCKEINYIEIQSLENHEDEQCGLVWENQHGDWQDFDQIDAWMPLPEPWKGEENG